MDFLEFEEKIGYSFKDKTLLELALTHSSYANENKLKKNNERFEFLGDSVLGFVTAEYLFTEYNPEYVCNCSKDYIDGVLITLGEKELYDTIEKEGKIEICCHFCNKKYVYFKSDVDELLGKK